MVGSNLRVVFFVFCFATRRISFCFFLLPLDVVTSISRRGYKWKMVGLNLRVGFFRVFFLPLDGFCFVLFFCRSTWLPPYLGVVTSVVDETRGEPLSSPAARGMGDGIQHRGRREEGEGEEGGEEKDLC